MKAKPIKDRVLIKQNEGQKEVSNFTVVNSSVKKPARGIVVAIGSEVEECKVDDDVDYNEHATTEHEIEGIKYVLVRECEIQLIR